MHFIDLMSQYAALRDPIGRRIQAVLDHGQYITELEQRLASWCGAPSYCLT